MLSEWSAPQICCAAAGAFVKRPVLVQNARGTGDRHCRGFDADDVVVKINFGGDMARWWHGAECAANETRCVASPSKPDD